MGNLCSREESEVSTKLYATVNISAITSEDDTDDDEFLDWDITRLEQYRNYVVNAVDQENFVLKDPSAKGEEIVCTLQQNKDGSYDFAGLPQGLRDCFGAFD